MSEDTKSFTDEYKIEEFKALREQIDRYVTEQRAVERYIIVADAAVYSVLAFPTTQGVRDATAVDIAWWIPPLIGVFGLVRWRETIQMVVHFADYIRQNEPQPNGGWETFLASRRNQKPRSLIWYVFYWVTMIGGTGALAVYKTAERFPNRPLLTVAFGLLLSGAAAAAVMAPRVALFPHGK